MVGAAKTTLEWIQEKSNSDSGFRVQDQLMMELYDKPRDHQSYMDLSSNWVSEYLYNIYSEDDEIHISKDK